jgi:glycosyltransferase involved in cell wall biosynthesis
VTDEPVRVLRVIARLNVGGPALHVAYLCAGLDRIGYETVLAAGQVGSGEGSMEAVAAEYGVIPRYISGLQREIEPWKDAAAVARLLAIMREFRPHIVHTHTAKAGALGRVAAQLAGPARPRAVVHTFHGHVLRGYFNPALTAGFRQVERRLARITDALIAVSPEVRDDLVRLGIAAADRITVVRLGLDLEARTAAAPGARAAQREALGADDDAFVVGWLGRMTEIKRVSDLIDAFSHVRAQGVDAHLALVGDGPLRPQLEARARTLGIADRCHFLGYREDVGSLYRAFDTVALTSANEGTPVTLIEALAAGLPAVATDVGGVRDVVDDGATGFLVPAGDVRGIGDALVRLAADPGERARMGADARLAVGDRYAIPRLVSDVDALYRRLLEGPARAARRRALTPPLEPAFPDWLHAGIEPAPRRLRVLIVSQYFPPEVGATQSRMQAFAEYLAARGHEVTVIAEFPNHPRGVLPDVYRRHLYEDDRSNHYRVLRVWVKTGVEKSQATRLAFYGSFTAAAAAVGPLAGRADVVLATTPPLFTGVAAVALARMSRAPLVLDVRDLWPAAAEALAQIRGRPLTHAAVALERWLYRQSDAVVAVTRPFCGHIDRIRGGTPATVLIPNGTLEMFFEETVGDGVRAELGVPEDAFLVTFAGTHGIAQSLPSVIDAAARVNGRVHFAFVGEGPVKQALEDDARARGLGNVHFHPQVPITVIPRILASSDALLVPLSGHPLFESFMPSKLVDFMAAGKPVVLSAAGESARIVERTRAGVVVAPEDAGGLAEATLWLSRNPAEAVAMAERGRSFARRRLRSVQAERLEQVLFDVVRRR